MRCGGCRWWGRWEARRRLGGFAIAGGGGDKVGEEDEGEKIKIGLVFK